MDNESFKIGDRMMVFLYAGIFGALGVCLRLFLQQVLPVSPFSWGILLVNVVGSFVIGAVFAYQNQFQSMISPALYTAFTAGFLGALTTFSSFSLDTMRLFHTGYIGWALVNILTNNLLCVGGCLIAYSLATYVKGS